MKKLMIAAAIVCAAALSHAAALDWSASAVYDPWTTASASKNTPAVGWLGYCILEADYATVTADLQKGDTASLLSSAVGPKGKISSNKGAFDTSTATGSVAAGDQNFYLIVLNSGTVDGATYYYASAATPKTVDASLPTTVAFGSQATGSKPTTAWTAMAPEPTSGMLLLLGMGALALRRRRA